MSALLVGLVEIPAKFAKILMEASAVTKLTAPSDIIQMARAKSKRNILFNRSMH